MQVIHWLAWAGLLLPLSAAVAQDEPPPHEKIMVFPGAASRADFVFVERTDLHPVKGAPYTATAITESTQVLSDGNRIVHKQSGLTARDGQGRVRREESMGGIGPLQLDGPKMVFIHDPVAKAAYVLNLSTQTARVMTHDGPQARKMMLLEDKKEGAAAHVRMERRRETGDLKTESLGTQQLEGVNAEGKRVTRTIPAGAIGNEQPLVITVESWTSPELHTLVLEKRNDPRFGETVFRLTNIKLGEPDPALFQIPSGFKTEQGPPPPAPPPGE
jgi:hypothetical protein